VTDTPLAQRFADAMGQLLGPDFPSDIGLAVSGGGDSMAMLTFAHNWTRDYGVRLWVATVDHGLRAESASEAAMVAEECATLGWPHATLRWSWDGQGNVQDAARRARLALIDRWRGGLRHVLFAHTQDDQAETVLMRLARGSGVDGLSGMRACRHVVPHTRSVPPLQEHEVTGDYPPREGRAVGFDILRPCLGMARDDLRHYLRVLKGRWVEDPSNEDRSYDRVRVRELLRHLGEEGITADQLAATAWRLARARDGLQARLSETVRQLCSDAPLGQVRIDRDGFAALDRETQLRMLTSALCYVASSEYRPRASASEALLDRVVSGGGGTLHGAEVLVETAHLRVMREAAAVRLEEAPPGTVWDGQWVLEPVTALTEPATIRALGGDGWQQIEDRSDLPLPHRAALGLPSLWSGDRLVACPALTVGPEVEIRRYVLGRPDTGFEAFCLSH
jgi:tRNA(Ile)-lysidine synthase